MFKDGSNNVGCCCLSSFISTDCDEDVFRFLRAGSVEGDRDNDNFGCFIDFNNDLRLAGSKSVGSINLY